MTAVSSPNFGFLAAHDPQLVKIGADAERLFVRDPDLSLIRLRQLGERLAQRTAALTGLYASPEENQIDFAAAPPGQRMGAAGGGQALPLPAQERQQGSP